MQYSCRFFIRAYVLCLNPCRLSACAGSDQEGQEEENQNPGQTTASAGNLSSAWRVSHVVVIKYGPRCLVQTTMRDENLSRTTVVVRADGSTLLKLSQKFGGSFVTDVETVAQHHRCDGRAAGKKLQSLMVEGILSGQGRR